MSNKREGGGGGSTNATQFSIIKEINKTFLT
jgi:hypothetical protein